MAVTDNRGNLARKDFIGNVDYTDDVNRITNVNDACRHYGSNVVINNGNQNPTGIQQAPTFLPFSLHLSLFLIVLHLFFFNITWVFVFNSLCGILLCSELFMV